MKNTQKTKKQSDTMIHFQRKVRGDWRNIYGPMSFHEIEVLKEDSGQEPIKYIASVLKCGQNNLRAIIL